MDDLATLPFTIRRLHEAYAAGLRPDAVLREVGRRLAAAGDPGIFIALAPPAEQARAAEALGPFDPGVRPLWGVPVAVKDNIDVALLPTTAACPGYSYQPEADAEAVAGLRRAGALIVGKTNLDQFATGLVGMRTPYPPPRNACDPALVPGGSSSGSAVAVARGIVALALGTDTAGSGRVPAALNNIVGLKPSLGSISARGIVPACRTLDTVSVFALTVEDAWTAYVAMAGYDAADPFSRPMPAPAWRPRPPVLRIGVPAAQDRRFFDDGVTAEAYDRVLASLESLGARIVPVPFADFFAVAALLYEGAWVAERYAAIREVIENRPDILHPVTRQVIGAAAGLSASDAFEGGYRLKELQRRIEPLWSELDCLCVPSITGLCTLADVESDPIGANSRLGAYTNFVNLLDLAAIAVPTGARGDGRPASVTLIGRSGADGALAALASDLQAAAGASLGATGWPLETHDTAANASSGGTDDRIPLAVVGAHLSGMPLNGQLTALGGVFQCSARTAPDYRFYALAGTIPAKPGLLRCRPGAGAAIAVEVWALSPEAFGRFVAAVPPPLSIGTLSLEDRTEVKGFLVEAEATAGARDITAFGGWRAYMDEAAGSAG